MISSGLLAGGGVVSHYWDSFIYLIFFTAEADMFEEKHILSPFQVAN